MGRLIRKPLLCIIVSFLSLLLSSSIYGNVDLTTLRQKTLEFHPRDVAASEDGSMVFILAPGELILYSPENDEIISRFTIDTGYDKISYSGKNHTLVLTSRSSKLLKMIQVEQVYDISLSGLPFKGASDAPVTIAVFDDYQ